jgi:averantin hydroxylase
LRSTLRGDFVQDVLALHRQFGDVVRLAPDELSFINAAAWKDIYGHRQGHDEFAKDRMGQQRTVNGVANIVDANRADHSRYRRLLSHAFSDKGLRKQEPIITHYVDLLIRRLYEYADQGPQNILDWYNWTTFDLTGDLTFSEPFHCLENARTHP